ncbi:MAG: hypothetical protein P8X89_06605 [Reinekea sp.]
MFFENWSEPMGAPAIFEKQIKINCIHSGVTDSGLIFHALLLTAPFSH